MSWARPVINSFIVPTCSASCPRVLHSYATRAQTVFTRPSFEGRGTRLPFALIILGSKFANIYVHKKDIFLILHN